MKYWEDPDIPQPGMKKAWLPKNPEISFTLRREIDLTEKEWNKSSFPYRQLPNEVKNHVNLTQWRKKIEELPLQKQKACMPIMSKVLDNLERGCNAKIGLPGSLPTVSSNNFEDPQIDIRRIADALATEIKAGHMAGPFPLGYIENAKINGLISVVKPDGSRRQVGNLSAPKGRSFNDGIDPSLLKEWRVKQTTSRDIADMILRTGKDSILSCSDMTSAYKNLPVAIEQRRLQVFRFCGKEFVDLKLIFGDKAACMYYDRFHFCIINYFVLPIVGIPRIWTGQTVDDLTSVIPSMCSSKTKEFVSTYRSVLKDLNIGAAPADPQRKKAFDGHTSGEMLGIVFNTVEGTWHLPREKAISLLGILEKSLTGEKLSLKEVEILHGKLSHFTQHAPALSLLISEVLVFLKMLHEEEHSSGRNSVLRIIPDTLKRDLRTIMAIVRYTLEVPLPIVEKISSPAVDALKIWTDASGHLIASPSIGVYVPSELGEQPLVASLALPRHFLLSEDSSGHKGYHKTTALECLGLLAALTLDPMRFVEREALFHMDNIASVYALKRGHSKKDEWATTLVRAARVVAAGLGCSLFIEWERRRTSRESIIADELTHNLVQGLDKKELEAYLLQGKVAFADPILEWMAKPRRDPTLGERTLSWLKKNFVALKILYEK